LLLVLGLEFVLARRQAVANPVTLSGK
jgi:hypothetical protein